MIAFKRTAGNEFRLQSVVKICSALIESDNTTLLTTCLLVMMVSARLITYYSAATGGKDAFFTTDSDTATDLIPTSLFESSV